MKVQVNKMFDIDKLNIYWAADTEDKIFGRGSDEEILDQYDYYVSAANEVGETPMSFENFYNFKKIESSQDRELLEYEKQIILHPKNAHHLLMPLTDEIFVKDIYNELVEKGVIEKVNSSFVGAMLPDTNVRNAIIFVKGKYGIGPVALAIVNLATNQVDGLDINRFYQNQDGEVVSTALLFKDMEETYGLDYYTDNEGTIISEILSQLLTTQVDNVKNPTAVLMNINMQTLGVMLYLIRRKINPKSIVLFLQQPIISEYLKYQRRNESLFNKQADAKSNNTKDRKHELSKKYLIQKLLNNLGYSTSVLPEVYRVGDEAPRLSITNTGMFENIKAQKFDQTQLDYLAYFLELQSQSRAFSDFQQTQNSDTKGLKDKQMLDESDAIFARTQLSQIISSDDITRLDRQGVISPFYQYGRLRYNIFNQFYALTNSIFGDMLTKFKDKAAELEKSENKDRVRQTIENDFLLFLIHNYGTSKAEFDRLTKEDSVAKRVLALKDEIPSNLVLKSFFPVLRNTTDLTDNKKIDNLRLFEKELSALDSNDMRSSLEEIHDRDPDLYNDIVKLLMFQSGLNISPFNYRSVVPVGLNTNRTEFNDYEYLYQDIIQDAVKAMRAEDISLVQAKVIFEEFKVMFGANNVKFLKKYASDTYPYPIIKSWGIKSKDWVLTYKTNKDQTQTQLGNAYHKQYFRELIKRETQPNKAQPNKTQDKNVINDIFGDHQDVVAPRVESPVTKLDKGTTTDPMTIENFDDFEVVWSSEDLPGSTDEFFPSELYSNQSISVGKTIDVAKTKSFEKEIGIRNSDGTRKKTKESDYETALRKVKRLNSKYPLMFELIKTTGEKGDSRVYYSIRLNDYGSKLVSMNFKPDTSLRDKYFENGSKTDAKTILEKIAKSDSNLAILAKRLLKYADVNNVDINLVDHIDETVLDNGDRSITAGKYYSRNSTKTEKRNSISIAEFTIYNGGRSEATIIHEILHALTLEELFYKNNDAAKDFEKLFEYVKANSPKGMYALTDLDEFMAGIFTDAGFIQHLKTLPPTKSIKEYKNLFEEILDLFRRLFKLEDTSALTQALSIASHVLSDVKLKQDYKDSFKDMKESAASRATIPQVVSNKSVEVLEKYLHQFGITVKMINEIKEKLEIDELGFADILSKIAYVKDKKDLPPIAGKFIAYMMQHNPLISDIIKDYAEEDKKLKSKTSALYYVAPGLGKTELAKNNPNKFVDMDDLIAQAVKTITGKTIATNEASFLIGKDAEVTEELKRLIEEVKNTHIILSPLNNSKIQLLGFNYSKYFVPSSNNKNKILKGISERTGNPFEISEEDYNKMYVKPHETRKNTKVISSYISEEFKNLDRNLSNITEYLDPKEYSSSDNYKTLDKDEYFDRIGMMIANKLQEQVNLPVNNSIISKIVKLIKEFFAKLSGTRVNRIDQNIATIVDRIIQDDKDLITVNKYKPGAYGQEVSPVSIEKALEADVFGKEIVTRLSRLGFILTGSTALSEQGVILRPNENPLHDIDWVSVFNKEETLKQFKKAYPKAIFVRNINTKGSGYETDSFLIVPDGYSVSNYKVNMYGEKIIVASYDVVDSNNVVVGTYNLKTDPVTNKSQEVETGIKGKIIDFFINIDSSNNDRYSPYRYISKNGDLILLSHWKDIFKAKLAYARYKDIWDYNRFIPNDNLTSSEKYDSKQPIIESDNSQSNYSPSLKMYEGFINLNKLYTGDEILPFIGQSEYYRYLVPMLLKMNPSMTTEFTKNVQKSLFIESVNQELPMKQINKVIKADFSRSNGVASGILNAAIINMNADIATTVHEMIHLTLQKEYDKNGEFREKIDELYKYAWDRQVSDGTYGFTNPKEFLAEAMSNPEFMEELNNIQYKEETVWSYLMTLVSDFINGLLNIELKSDSVLAEVVRVSEQVLNKNITEISKNNKVSLSSIGNEIVQNWESYFPEYSWMNEAQKLMTAKLVEEGKITLNCSF